MKRIYLAGPIELVSEDVAMEWRADAAAYIAENTECESVDPMHYEDEDSSDANIVNTDKALIKSCDAVLVDGRTPGWGTAMEVLFAWERNIPVVVWGVTEYEASKWLRHHSVAVIKSLPQAVFKAASVA